MDPVTLSPMTPAQEESWRILLDLYPVFPTGWCLIGGQMVWLFAHEYNADPIRATEDVDVAVDIRADQQAIKRMCAWLESPPVALPGSAPTGTPAAGGASAAGCTLGGPCCQGFHAASGSTSELP
jgi:hypothetical protein